MTFFTQARLLPLPTIRPIQRCWTLFRDAGFYISFLDRSIAVGIIKTYITQHIDPIDVKKFWSTFLPSPETCLVILCGSVVVKALRCWSEGLGIDPQCCHWGFFFLRLTKEPCALGSTQPLKINTRKTRGGVKTAGA